jgi:hypothetical protein
MFQEVQANIVYSEYVYLFCQNILLSKWATVKGLGIIVLETCMNISTL